MTSATKTIAITLGLLTAAMAIDSPPAEELTKTLLPGWGLSRLGAVTPLPAPLPVTQWPEIQGTNAFTPSPVTNDTTSNEDDTSSDDDYSQLPVVTGAEKEDVPVFQELWTKEKYIEMNKDSSRKEHRALTKQGVCLIKFKSDGTVETKLLPKSKKQVPTVEE